jgi:hypothetical protein
MLAAPTLMTHDHNGLQPGTLQRAAPSSTIVSAAMLLRRERR